jgi:hypothetical protein
VVAAPRLVFEAMRAMLVIWTAVIVAGLVLFTIIGLTHH